MPKAKRNPLFKNKLWNECYEHFLESFPNTKTRALYNSRLRQFFADGTSPDRKTRADIETWLTSPTTGAARPGLPPSPATQNGRVATLGSFYHYASTYLVPFRGSLRPILRGPRPDTGIKFRRDRMPERDMDEGEPAAFLAVIDRSTLIGKRDYAIFLTLLITGRRVSEITNLRWRDLEQVVFLDAPGGRPRVGHIYHFQGKGHLSKDDAAEWPDACMKALQDYLELAGKWDKMEPDDPLFVRHHGFGNALNTWPKEPVHYQTIDHRFRKHARAAGLPENIVCHSLRHESAWQRYCANGHDILRVKDDLRHTNIATTMRYVERRKRKTQGDSTAAILAAQFAH